MGSIPYALLNHEHYRVRSALRFVLGSQDAADIAIKGMRLQAKYGDCFASAAFLGHDVAVSRYIKRNGFAPEPETIDAERIQHNAKILTIRILNQMRSQGLVATVRRVRPDQTQGTNLVDFTALWRVIWPIVQAMMQTKNWEQAQAVMRSGVRYIGIKIQSLWSLVRVTMPPIPPPRDPHDA
jgi:hypothetical protein